MSGEGAVQRVQWLPSQVNIGGTAGQLCCSERLWFAVHDSYCRHSVQRLWPPTDEPQRPSAVHPPTTSSFDELPRTESRALDQQK